MTKPIGVRLVYSKYIEERCSDYADNWWNNCVYLNKGQQNDILNDVENDIKNAYKTAYKQAFDDIISFMKEGIRENGTITFRLK